MIIMMGLAGAGKGTQAQMLVDKNNYSLISTGEMLRTFATEDQKKRMHEGVLLRDDEIFTMIGEAIKTVTDLKKCILDGTPRSIPQAEWLVSQAAHGKFSLDAVIHLGIDEAVVRKRLLARARTDDTESSITKRFEEYHRATEPLLDYLEQQGVAVHHINGDQPTGTVHQDILKALQME